MPSATITQQTAIRWNDKYLLGYAPMDEIHEEFVQIVKQLQLAGDSELPILLAVLETHTRSHFEMENALMNETKFPARDCHIDEHAAVLKSIEDVKPLVASGNFDVCRRLANELATWFPGHADYLDSALSHWMCKKSFGGKPVVIRRSIDLR
ncbi:MAG: hemerythrin domain-containing protein [Burkholderiaceae bacterium]|nr:hemerythrin domain-containing protein [Burkholderiaceae bacterium]